MRALWIVALCCAIAGPARAQDRFSVENFDPVPDRDGGFVAVHGARPLRGGEYGLHLMGSYGRAPMSLHDSAGKELGDLVGSVSTLSLLATVGIASHLDIGVAAPLHRMAKGGGFDVDPGPVVRDALLTSTELGLGDVRVVPRIGLMVPERDQGAGIALVVPVWLPTGDDDIYAGESWRVEPRLVLDVRDDGVHGAINVGYMIRKRAPLLDESVDDQLRIAMGLEIPLRVVPISGLIELDTQSNVRAAEFSTDDLAAELRLGMRVRSRAGVQLDLGAGPSIVRGTGSPSYRLYASLGFGRYIQPVHDSDGDGLLDPVDRCPSAAEDPDGFEDADGCPDLDNDRDGVPDAMDRCRNDAEDRDGFEDIDGCPDVDDDQDGVADRDDRCPREPEDTDDFQDDDGCPEDDNDNDTVLDVGDNCVNEPGPPENQGCPLPPPPPEPPPLAMVKDDRIEIRDMIYFAVNKATIEARSSELLDAIAGVLNEHPEIELLRVEGHTDNTGKARRNQRLSEQRAKAVVKALIKRGIARKRLTSRGFGSDRPIVPNDTDDNRAQNRRTELHIEKRAEAPASPSEPAVVPAPVTPAPIAPAPAVPESPPPPSTPAPPPPAPLPAPVY
jgi:outer membrane protein OmpA-like peptidoglycan-associated protein